MTPRLFTLFPAWLYPSMLFHLSLLLPPLSTGQCLTLPESEKVLAIDFNYCGLSHHNIIVIGRRKWLCDFLWKDTAWKAWTTSLGSSCTALAATVTHTNIKMHKTDIRCTLMHSPFGFYLSRDCSCSAAGNLFYLNGTSLAHPCPSLDVVQCQRSQTE